MVIFGCPCLCLRIENRPHETTFFIFFQNTLNGSIYATSRFSIRRDVCLQGCNFWDVFLSVWPLSFDTFWDSSDDIGEILIGFCYGRWTTNPAPPGKFWNVQKSTLCAKKHSVTVNIGLVFSIPIWRFDIFLNGVATSPPWFEIDYDHGCENHYVVGWQKSGYCNQLTWIFHILVWNGAPTNSLEKRCILIALLKGTNPKQCWQYLETETSIFLVATPWN